MFSKIARILGIASVAVALSAGLSVNAFADTTAPVITNLTLTGENGGVVTAPKGVASENGIGNFDLEGFATYHMNLSFDGPLEDGIGNFNYRFGAPGARNGFEFATLRNVDSNHESTSYWDSEPSMTNFPAAAPGTTQLPIRIPAGITPGKYEVSLPITVIYSTYVDGAQSDVVLETKTAVGGFTVNANVENSKNATSFTKSGSKGKKNKITFRVAVPEYLIGAKVSAYYRQSGKHSYKKVASSRINSDGDASFKTSKGKIRHAGYVYLRVDGVKYASGYQTKTLRVR